MHSSSSKHGVGFCHSYLASSGEHSVSALSQPSMNHQSSLMRSRRRSRHMGLVGSTPRPPVVATAMTA
eukprot:11662074-Karenia_brevis.AAC.1